MRQLYLGSHISPKPQNGTSIDGGLSRHHCGRLMMARGGDDRWGSLRDAFGACGICCVLENDAATGKKSRVIHCVSASTVESRCQQGVALDARTPRPFSLLKGTTTPLPRDPSHRPFTSNHRAGDRWEISVITVLDCSQFRAHASSRSNPTSRTFERHQNAVGHIVSAHPSVGDGGPAVRHTTASVSEPRATPSNALHVRLRWARCG